MMTTRSLRLRRLGAVALVLAWGAGACACVSPPPFRAEAPARAEAQPAPSHALRTSVTAPSRVPYDADLLGVGGRFVGIRVTNESNGPVRLRPLSVRFTASRGGVPFACGDASGHASAVEPTWLAPGQSFAFEQKLACRLPLLGLFDVSVFVQAGEGAAAVAPTATFRVDVEGGARAPRAYPSREGLFVMMTGGKATQPLPPEAWARGDYSVVVAIINGGREPVSIGSGRLAFLVYKLGSPLPCSGQAGSLVLPDRLAPGAMHIVRAPVACAPSEEGRYEIVGRLSLGGGGEASGRGEEVEIGRIALRVTRDPTLLAPERWPMTPERVDSRLR